MRTQDEERDLDPFLCGCAKCDAFWRKLAGNKSDPSLLGKQLQVRAADTTSIYAATRSGEKHQAILRIGDRVLVKGHYTGVVRYVGVTDDSQLVPTMYVGVKLDDQVCSVHNGINLKNGKRYFHCPRGHGALVKYTEVRLIRPAPTRPPVYGNSMFPSYTHIRKARRLRAQMDPCFDLGPPYTNKQRPASSLPLVSQKRQMVRSSSSIQSLDDDHAQMTEQQTVNGWRRQFGGGARAEALVRTLQKLHVAYEEGRRFVEENGQDWESKLDQDNPDETQQTDRGGEVTQTS